MEVGLSYDITDCPHCGLSYAEFRTGETFQSIKDSLWVGSDDPADWKYKRKGTVLGRWHQLKKELWVEHVENCIGDSGEAETYTEVCHRCAEY